jgi:hypothetical protein
MGKLFGSRKRAIVLFAVFAACSGDKISAPGVCPQFCATVNVEAVDSVLGASIQKDSTYIGYVRANLANQIMVSSANAQVESRAVFHFTRFNDTIPLNVGDTVMRPFVQTDSFRLMLVLNRQAPGVTGMRYAIYRLPRFVDSTTSFADLAPYFNDSTFIREFPVQDTSASDSVFIPFNPAALPNFVADSGNITLGVALRSATPAFIELGTTELLRNAVLQRFGQVDSVPGSRVIRESDRGPSLDTFVFPALPTLLPNELAIGSAPSARSIMRLTVPKRIVDSSNVIRATILLIPSRPVVAPPGDTLRIVPNALATDVGPKSPVRATVVDTAGRVGAKVVGGVVDTIRVDITDVIKSWKGDTLSARSLILRLDKEGGTWGEVRFWSTSDPLRKPLIDITYVPPVNYEGR